MMRTCAFLTLSKPDGFVIDDELAYAPMERRGWRVLAVPWDEQDVDWSEFDLVVIRSTWDYHHSPERFLQTLRQIEQSGTRLENPSSLVQWNYRKTYLRDLATRGIAITPTLWRDNLDGMPLSSLFDETESDEIIIKPVVSASADGTFRLRRNDVSDREDELRRYFARRPLMIQPLVQSVIDEGEYSLFYFNGMYSHTILKTPKTGDFRVQEEHGGIIRLVTPDKHLLAAGDRAMKALDVVPLYARVDFVRSNAGETFWLMEFELIEPALYFRMDPHSAERFAEAVQNRFFTETKARAST